MTLVLISKFGSAAKIRIICELTKFIQVIVTEQAQIEQSTILLNTLYRHKKDAPSKLYKKNIGNHSLKDRTYPFQK